MSTRLACALAALCGLAAFAPDATARATAPPESTFVERGRAAYMGRNFDRARDFFLRATIDSQTSAEAHAWLAAAHYRRDELPLAWAQAHVALGLDPCNTLALEMLGITLHPQHGTWERTNADSAWACVVAGVQCDSLDGDLWKDAWIGALGRGDAGMARRALRGLRDAGTFAPPLFTNSRWTLSGLPPDAILLVNGDADCYPTLMLQQLDGLRTDVTLVHALLLGMPWYRRYVRDSLGVPMPFAPGALDSLDFTPDGSGGWIGPYVPIARGWVRMRGDRSLVRPFAMASTMDPSWQPETRLRCGAFDLVDPGFHGLPVDTATIRRGIQSIDFAQLAGDGSCAADRSPYLRGAGEMVRGNVAGAAILLYWFERSAGARPDAEQALAVTLSGLESCGTESHILEVLRRLPAAWEREARAAREKEKHVRANRPKDGSP